ncbi:hypothetical protein K1W69_02920 [Hoeflea sp. WL0058]|uniref:Uncharacterized protein n=1 Tax=Flavimaribacter sediminis TaxID=2865987 RepID=A0AAE3CZV9_9HYPH|nr:hypothetical protein [Flavimaribacter sediminis]MBW8636126.1 hypothetical protein [Flavimaribacter sediminis]
MDAGLSTLLAAAIGAIAAIGPTLYIDHLRYNREEKKILRLKYEELFSLVFEEMRALLHPEELRELTKGGIRELPPAGKMMAIAYSSFPEKLAKYVDEFERNAANYRSMITIMNDDAWEKRNSNNGFIVLMEKYLKSQENVFKELKEYGQKKIREHS